MYLLNASKAYYYPQKNRRSTTKKRKFLYLYDDNGKFHRPKVSFFKFYYSKFFKKKAKIKTCLYCKEKFCTYEKQSLLCGLCSK